MTKVPLPDATARPESIDPRHRIRASIAVLMLSAFAIAATPRVSDAACDVGDPSHLPRGMAQFLLAYEDAWQNLEVPVDLGSELLTSSGLLRSVAPDRLHPAFASSSNPIPMEMSRQAIKLAKLVWTGVDVKGLDRDGNEIDHPIPNECIRVDEALPDPANHDTPALVTYTKAVTVKWRFIARRRPLAELWEPARDFDPALRQDVRVDGQSQFLFQYQYADRLANGSPKLIQEVVSMNDDDFFVTPPHHEVDAGTAHAANYAHGTITLNGTTPPSGTVVEAIDSRTGTNYPKDSDGTDNSGNYQTTTNNPIYAGDVSLRANNNTKKCPCTSDGIANVKCDADITGCGSPNVTMTCMVVNFSFPAWPKLAQRLRKLRNRKKASA